MIKYEEIHEVGRKFGILDVISWLQDFKSDTVSIENQLKLAGELIEKKDTEILNYSKKLE